MRHHGVDGGGRDGEHVFLEGFEVGHRDHPRVIGPGCKQSSQLSVRTRTNTHKVDCNAAAVTAKSEKPSTRRQIAKRTEMCSIYAPVDEWLGGADVSRDPFRIGAVTARVEFPLALVSDVLHGRCDARHVDLVAKHPRLDRLGRRRA